MKIRILVVVLVLVVASSFGVMRSNEFHCQRSLVASDTASDELAAFRLDKDIYHNTNNEFSDIRLFDETEKEIAFVVRSITANDTDTVCYPVHLKTEEFLKEQNGGAAVVFSRDTNDSIPTLLDIGTQTRNFEKAVTVSGSNDRKSWTILAKERPVFDYSQFIDIRNTSVEFTRSDYRFYKVQIDSVWDFKRSAFSRIINKTTDRATKTQYIEFMQLQEPFRFDEIRFSGKVRRIRYGEPLEQTAELHIDSVVQDTIDKATLLYLSSDREPVSSLRLSVSGSNFTRRVHVHATNNTVDNTRWERVGSAEIFSINTGNHERNELDIPIGSVSRYLNYRLTIMNGDNVPIAVSAVTGQGLRHEGLFFRRGTRQLCLCYGAEGVEAPRYDVGSVLRKSPVTTGDVWVLGRPEKKAVQKQAPPLFVPKYVLVGVLGCMVVVLVVVLGIAVQKVDENTGSEE